MTAFDKNFLFLRNPHGGVEDLAAMKAAGFAGVFVNVGDFDPSEWNLVRQRAKALGMFCGPWARTGQGVGTFDPAVVDNLVALADLWQEPLVVNSEKELDGTGATLTSLIASKVGNRDGAISMEPWLFANVFWVPVAHLPMLLQINPAENAVSHDPAGCKWHAHDLGCRCVYFTFGTAPPAQPSWYDRRAAYSLYTGDNAAPDFQAWSPATTGFHACQEDPALPPLTPAEAPYTGPYYGPSSPKGPMRGPTAKALKRAYIRLGLFDGDFATIDDHYNAKLEQAARKFQEDEGLQRSGQYGIGTWEKIRAAVVSSGEHKGEHALDQVAQKLLRDEHAASQIQLCYPAPVGQPAFVCQGLHETAGIAGNWAIDFCAAPGTDVLFVADAEVTKLSGHDPNDDTWDSQGVFGWSVHYRTVSGFRYYCTHLGVRAPLHVGQKVKLGQRVGKVGDQEFRPDHLHLGVTSPHGEADAKRQITLVSTAPKVFLA